MGHHHDHHGHHGHNHTVKNIKIAFILNLSFTIIEIIGGYYTNSMAILSDALHDLGDSLSLGIAWGLEKYSNKGMDHHFSYGYGRFSLLGALINSLILIGGSLLILIKAIPRLLNPEQVNPSGMIFLAVLGIVINGMAVFRLKKGNSINEKVVSWHLMEDVLGWIVVLIASIIMMFFDLPIIDPLLSIGITVYILINVFKNLLDIMHIFLQGVPKNLSIDKVEEILLSMDLVESIHHTHLWTLDGEHNYLSTHVVVSEILSIDQMSKLKDEMKEILKSYDIGHCTIEMETHATICKYTHCH